MIRNAFLTGLVVIGMGASVSAQATTATTTFQVSATVVKSCLVTANALSFGNYDPTVATPTDGSTTLSILCTVGTPFTVGLNQGTATGATVTTRKMLNGTNTLGYGLYQDSGRTTNWGNTPGTDTPASITAPVAATSMTVYGRIPNGENTVAGGYSDTITVTVNY